jgi:selenocysteine lyase/cysteine desulfurase
VVAASLEVPRWRRPSLAFSNTIDEIDRLAVAVERLARGV